MPFGIFLYTFYNRKAKNPDYTYMRRHPYLSRSFVHADFWYIRDTTESDLQSHIADYRPDIYACGGNHQSYRLQDVWVT